MRQTPFNAPPRDNEREQERIYVLECTQLLDTEDSEAFDRITRLATHVFDAPIALVSLVHQDRQWFKSRCGFDLRETDRDSAFCDRTIELGSVLVVEDTTQDERFQDNPLVVGRHAIRFYAGAPLVLTSGHALGSLCILDRRPRTFDRAQRQRLAEMAAMVVTQIELHQRAGRVNEVTRLPNRAQLVDDLERLCRDFPGQQRVLMLVDVIGQAALHAAVRAMGIEPLEHALRNIATRLTAALPPGAMLHHVSETRFSILLGAGSRESSGQAAVDVLNHMRERFDSGGVAIELRVQAGLVDFCLDAASAGDALRKASSAMHEAASSEQSHMWHDPCFDTAHRRAFNLARTVSGGLVRGEFRLVYQPKLNLSLGAFSGVEALARWTHPRYGVVPPGDFVPLVEETALIHEFTEWVLNTALAQLALWERSGISLTMAVNVSSKNLERPGFVDFVSEACARHGVSPTHLHIECTENAIMTSQATQDALGRLRDLGTQISLDDFGTGYSNLACLFDLPVGMLKLDQSLVMPIEASPRALKLVRSLIDLGHSMGYRMLAEGVETQGTLDLLVAAGCDAIQGYFLSKPLEAETIPAFLGTNRVADLLSASGSSPRSQGSKT